METLKLKIFDVLVNSITIEEFENWLYNSELLDEKLKENSLVFNVVNINYRQDNSLKTLKNIALTIFDEEDFLVMKIENNCKKIVNTNDQKNIENYVLNIVEDYDYDLDCSVYWEFYSLHYSFDGYEYLNYTKGSLDKLNLRTIEYAKTVLYNLKNCKSIEDKKQVLLQEINPKRSEVIVDKVAVETRKTSFKDKLFAFFNKI